MTVTNDNNKSNKKRLFAAAAALTVILALSVGVFAWFSNSRKLDTMTKVNAPTALTIGAGNKEDAKYIDMGGIDVSEGTSKDFVFCVHSKEDVGSYKLQLAHTTNIDFTYTIYKAQEVNEKSSDVVEYVDTTNQSHYYSKTYDTPLSGAYLNQDSETNIAKGTGTYHGQTYDEYTNVQKNAEPLYWQNDEAIIPTSTVDGFVDYYILEVSWNNTVKNDKETDMVYITASKIS